MNNLARTPNLLALLMVFAYLLRLLLLMIEGQFRFPDEHRYLRSMDAADLVFRKDLRGALDSLLNVGSHHGFNVVTFGPALAHRFAYWLIPPSDESWKSYWRKALGDFRFSSLFFIIPSVLSIAMIYLLSRQAGADEMEALLAAFLLAASNTFFMYSQHFLPYDSSLFVGLIALWLALRLQATNIKNTMTVGILAFLTLWIYNGHVTFYIMLTLIYCFYLAPTARSAIWRVVGMIAGALVVIAPFHVYNLSVLDTNIISLLSGFATTITHGSFSEGIILPFLYFINAETGIAIVWVLGFAMIAWKLKHSPSEVPRRRVLLWSACLLLLYLLMILFSNGLQMFVVYGRVARSLVPFIVMLCACGIAPTLMRYGSRAALVFVVCTSILALANFIPLIRTYQYRVLQRHVFSNYDDVSFESTFGPEAKAHGVRGAELPGARYRLVNAGVFYPITDHLDRPKGKVILEVPHFYKIRANQYEGLSAEARDIINSNDVKMWLIDTHDTSE